MTHVSGVGVRGHDEALGPALDDDDASLGLQPVSSVSKIRSDGSAVLDRATGSDSPLGHRRDDKAVSNTQIMNFEAVVSGVGRSIAGVNRGETTRDPQCHHRTPRTCLPPTHLREISDSVNNNFPNTSVMYLNSTQG